MAIKNIQFGAQLPGPATPVSPDGGLLVSAGQQEGQAIQVAAAGDATLLKATGDLFQKAGEAGLGLYKGSLESNMEKNIKATIDNYQQNVNLQASVGFLQQAVDAGAPPQAVQDALSRIDKYKAAITQGTMTRDQALLAIDATVKDYSNRMPGWASDFRKQASLLTGVEHMGSLYEHNLLTQKSMMEKQQELALKEQERLRNHFIDTYKRLPVGGMNGPDMTMFAQQAALQQKAADLDTNIKISNQTIAQSEPQIVDLINTRMADGVMTLNMRMQGIVNAIDPKTNKPLPPESQVVLRQQSVSDVNSFFAQLTAQVASFPASKLSSATREQQLTRLETQRKSLVDALSNQDAFDAFQKTMKIETAKAGNIMDKWKLANANLVPLIQTGVMASPLAEQWLRAQENPNTQADFARRSPNIDQLFRGTLANYGENYSKGITDPSHLDALKRTSPAEYQNALNGGVETLKQIANKGWGETPEVQKAQKTNFSNYIATLASQAKPENKEISAKWNELMSNPNIIARIKELSPQQQLEALSPMLDATKNILEDGTFGSMKLLGQLVERNTTDTSKVDIRYNDVTNKFEAFVNTVTKGRSNMFSPTGENPAGAATFEAVKGGDKVTSTPAVGELKATVDNINKSLGILSSAAEFKGIYSDGTTQEGIVKNYFNKFHAGFFNLPEEVRSIAPTGDAFIPKGKDGVDVTSVPADIVKADQTRRSVSMIKEDILSLNDELRALDKRTDMKPTVKTITRTAVLAELERLQNELKTKQKGE